MKYQDGLWIEIRKQKFVYWFRVLQIIEQKQDYKVDWSKYKGLDGAIFMVGSKFEDF